MAGRFPYQRINQTSRYNTSMEKTPIFTGAGPAAGAPYTPAVKVGKTLYISGQLGIDPETGAPHTDFIKQVEGAIAGLSALLEAAGGWFSRVDR
jgi:enamine deaminase RidA (YjgF/YER057c/UK114 family)